MKPSSVPDSQNAIRFTLENDKRDIKDLWNEALKDYKGILGRELPSRKKIQFKNVEDMMRFGVLQEDVFHKWRHDGKNLDKIRTSLMTNISFIETGTQNLLAVATIAFPPAAAIGTALTFVLSACKGQSADYDIVTSFLEEMNNFLERVTILEGRLPKDRAYQACLMDVFTAILKMCAFATKFMSKGRLKTWFVTSFMGQDADLSSARNQMDKNLGRLESATQFAILANTEGLKGGQQGLQIMQAELYKNQIKQIQLEQEQTKLLQDIQQSQTSVQDGVDALRTDLQAITAMMRQKEDVSTASVDKDTAQTNNSIRTSIPPNAENDARMRKLRESRLPGTGEWFFQTSAWKSWSATKDRGILLLQGSPGIGKSHLVTAAYDRLLQIAKRDTSQCFVVAYFFCDRDVGNLDTFDSFVGSTVLQISEQNSALQRQFAQKFASSQEVDQSALGSAGEYLKELILPSFGKDSRYLLHIVIDSIDNFEFQTEIMSMLESISRLSLRIKMIITCRSTSAGILKSQLRSKLDSAVETWTVEASRDDVLSDIKLLTTDRLQKSDETYGGLAYLSSKTRSRIKDQIEGKATTLLYVDFALRYLSGIGREGAILRELENGLPAEANTLFRRIVKSCKRRLPQDLSSPVQLLLIWLTYSFDLLDLDQANQLVQLCNRDDDVRVEDEIEYAFSRILRIGPTTKLLNITDYQILDGSSENAISVENVYDDGDLLVSLRDLSMRQLLRDIDITCWDRQEIEINDQTDRPITSNLSSTNHRLIFLYCCRILEIEQDRGEGLTSANRTQKLRQYAMRYCLRHWQRIDCNKHEHSENLEVCCAFYTLLANDHGLAAALETDSKTIDHIIRKSNTMSVEEGYQEFSTAWQAWAESIQGPVQVPHNSDEHRPAVYMHAETQRYWKGSYDNAFQPLFDAHMRNWLDGWHENWDWDPESARKCALAVLRHTPHRYLSKLQIADEYWKTWITSIDNDIEPDHRDDRQGHCAWHMRTTYLMRSLYQHPLTSTAHFATAVVLWSEQVKKAQHAELLLAMEKCTNPAQKAEIHIVLGYDYLNHDLDDHEGLTEEEEQALTRKINQEALYHVDSVIEMISDKTSTTRHSALLQRVSLLQRLNEIPCGGSLDCEIIEIFREIRTHSQRLLVDGGSILQDEMRYYRGNHDRLMSFFAALNPTQRLSLLVYGFAMPKLSMADELNKSFLPAAVSTGRVAEILKIYNQILGDLKLGNCEIIWYATLARSYIAMKDLQPASDVLRLASSYVFKKSYLKIGSRRYDASSLVEDYINLTSDVVYSKFRDSHQPDVKTMFLQEAEAILFQPLPQSIRLTPTSMIPHLIVLSRMQKRVGTFQKYQESLQQAFDMCWANLHDDSILNDMQNLLYLAKILAIAPFFHREAEIVSSAQLYLIRKYSDLGELGNSEKIQEAEGDVEYSSYRLLHDKGILKGRNLFMTQSCARSRIEDDCKRFFGWGSWGSSPMYICLCCATSILCQDCYDERIKRNGRPSQVETEIDFCCDAGEYIKAPMDGWKGVRDGKIYIENEEPVEFDTFLEQVRDKWKRTWVEFWKG